MPKRAWLVLELSLLVLFAGIPARGRAQVAQPRWTPIPVVPANASSALYVARKDGGGGAAWPYYSDSPLYAYPNQAMPQGNYVMTSPPVAASGQPFQFASTANNGGTFRFVPTNQPMPAPTALAPVAPSAPVSPVAPAVPASPASVPSSTQPLAQQPAPGVERLPDAPYVDERVFQQGGKFWREYDLTPYTGRFQANAQPEQAVRDWILRETELSTWNGMEVSSLVVTPHRVKIYHNAEVQTQIAQLLGRFLRYSPGQFRAKTRMLQAKESDWAKNLGGRLTPTTAESGRAAWLVDRAAVVEVLAEIVDQSDALVLANEDFLVANGQGARVRWISDAWREHTQGAGAAGAGAGGAAGMGTSPDTNPSFDGVEARFSPLIGEDASTLDLDVEIVARRIEYPKEGAFGSRTAAVPEVAAAEFKNRYRLPEGKALLVSLGRIPRFDSHKGLFGREKKGEVLVLIEVAPEGVNTVDGVPVAAVGAVGAGGAAATPSGTALTRTAAKPRTRLRGSPHVSEFLTRPVY